MIPLAGSWWPPSRRCRRPRGRRWRCPVAAIVADLVALVLAVATGRLAARDGIGGHHQPSGYLRTLRARVVSAGRWCVGAADTLGRAGNTRSRAADPAGPRTAGLARDTRSCWSSCSPPSCSSTVYCCAARISSPTRMFRPERRQPHPRADRSARPIRRSPAVPTRRPRGSRSVTKAATSWLSGPHADELTAINGRPAKDPIRIYAGLRLRRNTRRRGRSSWSVRDCERTGAFDRIGAAIIPTTGTGWVDPAAARAIESMYNGDTALVAMQYSYLPSWISFLADRGEAAAAGEAC